MFEVVLADVAEELLHVGDLDDAGSSKGVERVVGEFAFADVAGDFAGEVVGGEAGEAHGPGLDGGVAVGVVPVEECAGGFAGEGEGVHAERAEDVDFAGGGDELLAHHRHHGAGNDAEVLLDGGPALDGGDGEFGGGHPAVDDCAELGHLHEGGFGGLAYGDVLFDGGEFGLDGVVVVLGLLDAAHDLGEVEGLYGDAGAFEKFFGVADGVEGRGARADGAEADVAKTSHDAADGGEPLEVGLELCGVGGFGVERGERVGDAVLLEVVADGHLAAEAVAAEGDAHFARGVGRGLDEDGHVEIGQAERVGQAALFAEVWQRDDDAVDLGGVLLEEFSALLGVFVGFYGSVRGLFRGEHDGLNAHRFERSNHFKTPAGCEVAGEESAVSHDDSHRHLTAHWFSYVKAYVLLMSPGRGRYRKV